MIGDVRRQYDGVWRALQGKNCIAELDAAVVIDQGFRLAADVAQDRAALIHLRLGGQESLN